MSCRANIGYFGLTASRRGDDRATLLPSACLKKTRFQHEGTLRQRAWFKATFHDLRMFGRLVGAPMSGAAKP